MPSNFDLKTIRNIGVQGVSTPYSDTNFRKAGFPVEYCTFDHLDMNTPPYLFLQGVQTPQNEHIYYVQEPHNLKQWSGMHLCYFDQLGTYDAPAGLPWKWRNPEPFYIEALNETVKLGWTGARNWDQTNQIRFIWANILVNTSTKQIVSTSISDDFNPGHPLPDSMNIPAGHKLYIFRIDHNNITVNHAPDWDPNGDYLQTYGQSGVYHMEERQVEGEEEVTYVGVSDEHSYWTPGVAYFNTFYDDTLQNPSYHKKDQTYGFTPFFATGNIHKIGGCLSSLFVPCKDTDTTIWEPVSDQDSEDYTPEQIQAYLQSGEEYARLMFNNPDRHGWINQDKYRFSAESLFAYDRTLIDASRLELPVSSVPPLAYRHLFYYCDNLVTPPKELPALTIYPSSYAGMFDACAAMVESPIIYAQKMHKISLNYILLERIPGGSGHYTSFPDAVSYAYSTAMQNPLWGIGFESCGNLTAIYIKNWNWIPFCQGTNQSPHYIYPQGALTPDGIRDWSGDGYFAIPTPFINYSNKGGNPLSLYMRPYMKFHHPDKDQNILDVQTPTGNLASWCQGTNHLSVNNPIWHIFWQPTYVENSQILNIDDPQYHLQN